MVDQNVSLRRINMDTNKGVEMEWTTQQSKNGTPFACGVANFNVAKSADQMDVNWEVSTDKHWHETTPEFLERMGIERYRLLKIDGIVFTYQLEFTCTQRWKYRFIDGEGDEYLVDTYFLGDHSVNFNSNNAKIVYVSRSS